MMGWMRWPQMDGMDQMARIGMRRKKRGNAEASPRSKRISDDES